MNNKDLTIVTILRNMSYEGISRIMDGAILNIINEVDSSPDLKKLVEVVVDIYGEAYFLLNAKKRKILFEYLREDDANNICQILDANTDSDPWEALNRINLTRERKEKLFKYFKIEPTEDINTIEIAPDATVVSPEYGLFKHQENAAKKVKDIIKTPRNRVLLHMPTGSGKTRTSMSVACDFIRNQIDTRGEQIVIWFADTEELCNQAADEFEKAWKHLGVGDTNLYRLFGESKLSFGDISNGLVVAGLQKLNSVIGNDQRGFYEFGKKAGLLIFDEAHKVLADTYQRIIEVCQTVGSSALLGLSATPGRSTFDINENRKFAEFFQYHKVVLEIEGYENPVEYLQQEGYLANTFYHPLPYSPEELKITEKELKILTSGEEVPKTILKQLGIDSKRNILILSLALELVKDKRKIILFACSVENAEALYALLKYKDVSVGLVTSETDALTRRDAIEKYKHGNIDILVNHGVLTTGFDAPKTNAAIIARPTNSLTLFSQMVGRATRGVKAGGNVESNIYVINDALPGFRNMAEAFSHWDDAWVERE